jgi:hypothetical protein
MIALVAASSAIARKMCFVRMISAAICLCCIKRRSVDSFSSRAALRISRCFVLETFVVTLGTLGIGIFKNYEGLKTEKIVKIYKLCNLKINIKKSIFYKKVVFFCFCKYKNRILITKNKN